MDFILEVLSLGPFSVSALIIFIVYIYYMIVDDEEEDSLQEKGQEVKPDLEKKKFVLMSEIKHLREEESLGLLTDKNKARLDEIVKKYKQLSDKEE